MRRSTRVIFAALAGGIASAAHAVPVANVVSADGNVLDVEGVVGSGQYTSYEVIDFQDTGGGSYAWEYKYNTPVSGFQMLQNIAAADPRLIVQSTYYPEFDEYFVDNFSFESDSGNADDYWRYLNGVYDGVNKTVNWTDASLGAGDVMISNGSFDGWYNSFANDNAPRLPETGISGTALTWNNAGARLPGDGVTWDINKNNNWNNGAGATVYSDCDPVTFNDANGGHYTVTLNSTVSPGSVTVSSSGNYTISGSGSIAGAGSLTKSGSGTLTLSTANTYSGGTTVNGGTLLINPTAAPAATSALATGGVSITGGTLQLAPDVTLGSGSVTSSVNITSLSIAGSGVLDVNDNHIILDYSGASPISTIAGYVKSGYNGGAWNGPGGIVTSAPLAYNGLKYGLGYADGADGVVANLTSGQIEVAYTLLGDANLDGLVNAADFTILAANFNQPVTGWDQGNFNYDGMVNAADFGDLAANFNQASSGAATAGDVAALDAFAAANGLLVDVPEPGMAGAGLGLLCLLHRRKRREA
ncbi:MAG: autotransporter-associated beta strand repeat-containing protein [Tepidisphaeraceae bacterium]|jgi:autotransporter-associated beta strand protein